MTPIAPQTSRQGARTRRRILDAAIDQFGRSGYRGGSLARIADQAGVTQSNILHHFGSKAELLTTVLAELYFPTDDAAGIAAGAARGAATDPERAGQDPEPLADTFVAMATESARTPDRVRFFSVITGESLTEGHPAQEFFRRRYDALRHHYEARLDQEAAVAGVSWDPAERTSLVNLAVAALDGLQLQWLRNPEQVDLERETTRIAELLRVGEHSA